MLRDARRHFAQRAAREQTTIENVLAVFERDFDAWLDRESRGISSPKPSLATLFEIWLERGARRFDSQGASPETSLRQEAAAEAQALALQQRLDEESRRIQELERRLADAESREGRRATETTTPLAAASPALAAAAPAARRPRRGAGLFATLVILAALFGAAQWARHSEATPPELRAALARLDGFAAEAETRARAALGRLAASHAREDALETLLAENKEHVIARAVAADPQLARAKIEAIAPRQNEPVTTPPPEPPAPTISALPEAAALETPPTPAPQEEAERLPPAIIGAKPAAFRSFDNRDITGAALATLRKLDQPACVAACRSRADCAGYSFDRWNRICRLKTNIGAFRLNPRMTSGLRDVTRIPRAPSGALSMERYPSKAFPGSGYKTTTAEGPEACETACREEEACVAFTFRLDEGACHMFKTTGEYFSNELADSGGKRQD
ncbi:PAN domain-containing protein [Methylosinus sp. Ce-a6]|uniref:PAN domain-containing protein n=1 Tax=Methylosinus sp. Ce-a6 TaxID=2172005 RepID=UPI00135A7AEE|nr:PAN domain-containing protein [Methylosinus sp. Ce-a6]